jgi:arsenate reductase
VISGICAWYYSRSHARAASCLAIVNVQIFGIQKNQDVRKALRFFSERRVKVHFVDLKERAASLGELRRFSQKFGVGALIDKNSSRYAELGLGGSATTIRGGSPSWPKNP